MSFEPDPSVVNFVVGFFKFCINATAVAIGLGFWAIVILLIVVSWAIFVG